MVVDSGPVVNREPRPSQGPALLRGSLISLHPSLSSLQRGYTQLEVQQELGWGRSYISQLVTKQKSPRVEQVLLILGVIGVDPAEFFAEL